MSDKPSVGGGTTKSGLDPNLAAAIAYAFGWISGLIFFLVEPDNKFVRFHALQSIFLNIALIVAYTGLGLLMAVFGVIPGIGFLFAMLGVVAYAVLGVGFLILWIMLMIRAYQGEKFKLPVIGDLAEQNA